MLKLFKPSDNLSLIGLSGKAGAGKDYVATNCLKDYFKISLADHFKNDIVGKKIFTYEEVYYTKPVHVRHELQQIGTEQGRNVYGEDVWINCIEAWMYSIYRKNGITKFCIPDVRFENEARWINLLGGINVSISSNRGRIGMDETAKAHASEAGFSEDIIDYVLCNDEGTDLATLQYQINTILDIMDTI